MITRATLSLASISFPDFDISVVHIIVCTTYMRDELNSITSNTKKKKGKKFMSCTRPFSWGKIHKLGAMIFPRVNWLNLYEPKV